MAQPCYFYILKSYKVTKHEINTTPVSKIFCIFFMLFYDVTAAL